ncbi:MAG: hypothetical protein AAFY59_04175 [Pseudomonadota bacterium]
MTGFATFADPRSGFSVVFEDDGRVAYAYLLDGNDRIVGDVWLYNRCVAPLEPEWISPDGMPFANPVGYAREDAGFLPVEEIGDVSVSWSAAPVAAVVHLRGARFARLMEGSKPGWCVLALKDGPLARVMET